MQCMALFYILWHVLYAIATDPGSMVEVHGLAFSSPKIRSVTTTRWICVFPGKKPQNDRDDGRTRLYLQMLLCTHNLLQLLFLHVSRWMVLETYIVFMLWHDFSILEAERCSHFTHYYFYVAYSVHEIILNVWSVRLIQKFPNRHPSASSGAKKIVGRSKNCWER
jgi:hypothetical protein